MERGRREQKLTLAKNTLPGYLYYPDNEKHVEYRMPAAGWQSPIHKRQAFNSV